MINIVADDNIIFAEEAFSKFGKVRLIPGREITASDLSDSDVLITRSITNVNKKLLNKSKIKFVGTATIGNDHVDVDYLTSNNIAFANAAGCNADAVAEYVFTAILKIAAENNLKLFGKSIGIIGVGNIGSRVARLASFLGITILKNDPPLKRITHREEYLELEQVLKADIVTIHVPLNLDGEDKTFHLFDEKILNELNNECILINASRGQVIDNNALEKIIEKKKLKVVLDVWENEPAVNKSLLEKTFIGSPHIAGYSYEGKVNGTIIIYNALCRFLNVKPEWNPVSPPVKMDEIQITSGELEKVLNALFTAIYDINKDDKKMRKILALSDSEAIKYFDALRKHYSLRREFTNFKIKDINGDKNLENILRGFRFQIS